MRALTIPVTTRDMRTVTKRCLDQGDLMPTREHCLLSALAKSHGPMGYSSHRSREKRFDVVGGVSCLRV